MDMASPRLQRIQVASPQPGNGRRGQLDYPFRIAVVKPRKALVQRRDVKPGGITLSERCQSGRLGRSRKPVWEQSYRGFESLPLRFFDFVRFRNAIKEPDLQQASLALFVA